MGCGAWDQLEDLVLKGSVIRVSGQDVGRFRAFGLKRGLC